jgi:predicted nucleic acid-binding protein
MKSDSQFDYSEFKLFYYKNSFQPYLFLRNLIEIEDLFQLTIKSHYYHEVVLLLLKSKDKDNREFATKKLLTDYHRRYHHLFFEALAKMQIDTVYQKSYLDSLSYIAAQFERIEEIKSYKSKFDTLGFFANLVNDEVLGKRFNQEFNKAITDIDKLDIYLLDKKIDILPFLKEYPEVRYCFILSGKKFDASSFSELRDLTKDSTINSIEKSGIISLLNIKQKDSLHYLFRFPLSIAVHRAIFEQIELNHFSSERLQSYLELFVQRKLQRSIEKEIKNCPKEILENFIRKQLVKDNKYLSYLIYWVGIAKLDVFYTDIERFINHDNRIVSYEAEVTLKRLKNF